MENEKYILMALDNLKHTGIKGMRWGVRRGRNQSIRDARLKNYQILSDIDTLEKAKLTSTNKSTVKNYDKKQKELADEFSKNYDLAKKSTTGEKALRAIFAVGIGSLAISTVTQAMQ